MTRTATSTPAASTTARSTTVDLLVIGSGTGMSAALAAKELGLDVLIVEKTGYVGGSTARSGGAFWIPASPLLARSGSGDSVEQAQTYLEAAVGDTAAKDRWQAFLEYGPGTVEMLQRTTPMKFFWARGYSDYHPELPGGSAVGRTCECRPFDASTLGAERARLRPSLLAAPVPMPVTGADYKWMNLFMRKPARGVPTILRRALQGIGGKLLLKREYMAGGQALAAGLFAGILRAGIPVWTDTSLVRLLGTDRITGAVLEQHGQTVEVTARRGVVLATGGFDHDMAMRHEYQSREIQDWSLGSEGNTGDGIKIGRDLGADVALMDQAWWFPAVAPLEPGKAPQVLLAERSLPGSFVVDGGGRRFINESTDYMSFGQRFQERERAGEPIGAMWLVFDQRYRNSYVFAGSLYPRMAIPKAWFDAGIAHRGSTPAELARASGLPEDVFARTLARFNENAASGTDHDFARGASAYDRYYGDPTVTPNPNLRPLSGTLYAVKVVLSDLGTCGGLRADAHGRVQREDGSVIDGLYALGNNAANVFGATYPGAGATIGQGLVFGRIVAEHAARGPVPVG